MMSKHLGHNIPKGATHFVSEGDGYHAGFYKKDGDRFFCKEVDGGAYEGWSWTLRFDALPTECEIPMPNINDKAYDEITPEKAEENRKALGELGVRIKYNALSVEERILDDMTKRDEEARKALGESFTEIENKAKLNKYSREIQLEQER